jgi:hypothetical protein
VIWFGGYREQRGPASKRSRERLCDRTYGFAVNPDISFAAPTDRVFSQENQGVGQQIPSEAVDTDMSSPGIATVLVVDPGAVLVYIG